VKNSSITRHTARLGRAIRSDRSDHDIIDAEFRVHRRIDEIIPVSYHIVAFSLACIVFCIVLCVYCIAVAGLRWGL